MKNGHINERNAGHWSLDGEPKTRKAKKRPLLRQDGLLLLCENRCVADFTDGIDDVRQQKIVREIVSCWNKKSHPLTASDADLLLQILGKVIDCMAFDPDISERGHLRPDAKFTDGGRFMLCLTREQFEQLGEIYQKIEQ